MKNFLFDFDGTIADSGETAILAVQEGFKKTGLKAPSARTVRYYMGVPIEAFFPELAGPDFPEERIEELYDNFRQAYQELEESSTTLFEGMKETLAQLKADGKDLYVVSSKISTSLKRNLDTLGISEYFTDIIGSDQVENYKPAPDGVDIIVDRHGLDKNETIMIGDAKYDLQMGKAAGVHTCGCAWDTYDIELLKKEEPTYLFDKVTDLLTI